MGIIGRLHRVADALYARIQPVYRQFDLSDGEFDVLTALRRAGEPFELTAGGIAEMTMVTSGAVTKRVDRLLASGLVARISGATDARVRSVRLTEAGLKIVDAALESHVANEHELVASLTPDERVFLAGVLEKWGRAL